MPAVQHMTKCANLDPGLCQIAEVIKTNYCAAHFKLPVRKYWMAFQINSKGHIAVYVQSMLVQ
jgi:hypothetical protein